MSRQGVHEGQAREPFRKKVPPGLRTRGRALAVQIGARTAGLRLAPSFVMAGAQRCGTTSMYRALMAHPQVVRPPVHKGVNYFDLQYERGWDFYLGHFPLKAVAQAQVRGGPPQAFEASGYYLYHPLALPRLARDLPQAKVVVLLRDPVERAYSAWKHESSRGYETESFARAIELEDARIAGEAERIVAEPGYRSHAHRHYSYQHRGHYADQLERLFGVLPREQVHVVDSQQFFEDPATTYAALIDFLGLVPFVPPYFDRYNARPGAMNEGLRGRLREHFAPHDARLVQLLGRRMSWMD